jgi:hypothetical protein
MRGSRTTPEPSVRWSEQMNTQQVRGSRRRGSWTRLAGVCGLGWFLLFAVGGIILQGEPPAYDEPIAEARRFFADHGSRYLVGDYLADVAFVFLFLPFVAGLRGHLGAAEKGGQLGSRLVLAGGVATVVVGAASTAFLDAVALAEGGSALDDSTIRALLYADAVAIAGIGMPAALTAIAAAVVIWRTRALPSWLAPVGAGAGVQERGPRARHPPVCRAGRILNRKRRATARSCRSVKRKDVAAPKLRT